MYTTILKCFMYTFYLYVFLQNMYCFMCVFPPEYLFFDFFQNSEQLKK